MTIRKNEIPRIIAGIDETVTDAMNASAKLIAASAREKAPVRTGALRDSIAVKRVASGGRYATRAIVADVYYATMVENGSAVGGMGRPPQAPQPFLVPALEEHRVEVTERIVAALRRIVA